MRKSKKENKEIEQNQEAQLNEQTDENSKQNQNSSDGYYSIKTLESNIDTSFFYTNDKFINSFDDDAILSTIQSKYDKLNIQNTNAIIKKNIIYFLDDEKFVNVILNYYNITVLDLFKLLYKQFDQVFKGPYLKKIRSVLSDKKYAKLERRKTDF